MSCRQGVQWRGVERGREGGKGESEGKEKSESEICRGVGDLVNLR